jgi:S-adenosylmethionine hydrolase
VVELTNPRYARPEVSRTFEGRDRFAPAAAWLAAGIDLAVLGRPAGPVQLVDVPRPSVTSSGIDGEVLRVDRFGNLITNIDRRTFEAIGSLDALTIAIGSRQVPACVSTYAEARPGELCALFGSSDRLEIAANGASAATEIGAGRGAAVHVGRRA